MLFVVRDASAPASLRTASTSIYRRSPTCGSPCPRMARRVRGVTLTATLRLLPSLRPSHHIRVVSFGRLDATFSRVEKTSVLTLPDLGRGPPFDPLRHPCRKWRSNHALPTRTPSLETSALGAPAPSPSRGRPSSSCPESTRSRDILNLHRPRQRKSAVTSAASRP